MLDRLRRLVSGSDWRRPGAPFMERLAFQVGRVAFWGCVVFAVLLTIAGEWYGILLAPIGLFYWWFSAMSARAWCDIQETRRAL